MEEKIEENPELLEEKKRKKKQRKLDTAVSIEYQEKGCPNIIQSRFLKEIAKLVHNENDPKLYSLMSYPKQRDTLAWNKALCYCVAFLRRYKMEETLKTIRAEGGSIPKDTGFYKSSELEKFYKRLIITTYAIADKKFPQRLQEFNEDVRKAVVENTKIDTTKKASLPDDNEIWA